MEWEGRRESENVEDRRNMTKTGLAVGGGVSIIIGILYLILGGDPTLLFRAAQEQQQRRAQSGYVTTPSPEEEKLVKFAKVVLADTEDVWKDQFAKHGLKPYRPTTLVLFRQQVDSACGFASSAIGPFYCPADSKVYLDLSFFKELDEKFGAAGDFAQAYVIAHEVGHHVQNLLGKSSEVHRLQQRVSKVQANRLSVRLELQADYLAGVWGHYMKKKKYLEEGDAEEAINAAHQIGDDRLQKRAGGAVVPDSFTHGTSAQRVKWFTKGFNTGDFSEAKRNEMFILPYDEL